MFNVIRLIIGALFWCGSMIIIKKCRTNLKNKLYSIFSILSILFIIILNFLPFENLFVTFDSAEEAYNYIDFGSSNVELVVEGDESGLVIDRSNKSDIYLIIPKNNDGWKIGIGSDTKRISRIINDGIVVYVYQYKNTNDYYVTVLNTNNVDSIVYDSCNSNFYCLEKTNESMETKIVTYYAHITDFDSQYWIDVDGERIVFTSK